MVAAVREMVTLRESMRGLSGYANRGAAVGMTTRGNWGTGAAWEDESRAEPATERPPHPGEYAWTMQVVSVNVCGSFVMVPHAGAEEPTAHFKKPVSGRVAVGPLGLTGDTQADKRYHGGPHQAVYCISREVIEHWERELGRPLPPGSFGENLTVTGLPDDQARIGDVLRIGPGSRGEGNLEGDIEGVVLEVSLPRGPCHKLGYAMGDPGFPKRFLATCRVGFYCRVLKPGTVGAGDQISLEGSKGGSEWTIEAITRLKYFQKDDRAAAARAMNLAALAPVWREEFARRAGSVGSADGAE